MTVIWTTFTLDDDLAQLARELGVNISAAARQGVVDAVRDAQEIADREAYGSFPESVDAAWAEVEYWGLS